MKKLNLLPILLIVLSMSSCDLNQSDISPADEFVKIYNHPDENLRFFPQSVIEMPGQGFIILSGISSDSIDNEFPTSFLIGTNNKGEINWKSENNNLAPEGKLIREGSVLSYIAMDNQLNGVKVEIDPASGQLLNQTILDLKMPLFTLKSSSGNILVLSHDFINLASKLSLYSKDFTLLRSESLNINTDLQNNIQKHLNKSGKQYPFFIGEFDGEMENGFFVNCFSNYSLRVNFLNEAGALYPGNIYSFQTEAAISSFSHKTGNQYALTRYYSGNNYLIPDIEVEKNVSQNFNSIEGTSLFELTTDAAVVSMKMRKGETESILFASQTNSNSLIIYQYAVDSTKQISVYQRDFNDKIEVCDMIQSEDESIIVLGKIFILGKFPRPFLTKIPVTDFKKD